MGTGPRCALAGPAAQLRQAWQQGRFGWVAAAQALGCGCLQVRASAAATAGVEMPPCVFIRVSASVCESTEHRTCGASVGACHPCLPPKCLAIADEVAPISIYGVKLCFCELTFGY